jgi:hypothetical protein
MRWKRQRVVELPDDPIGEAYDPDLDDGIVAEAIRRLTAASLMSSNSGVCEEQHDGIGTEFVVVEFVIEPISEVRGALVDALQGLDFELRRMPPGYGILCSSKP